MALACHHWAPSVAQAAGTMSGRCQPVQTAHNYRQSAETGLEQERLQLFEPRAAERNKTLHSVATSLKYDEPDTAAALFARCGRHAFALEQLDWRLQRELKGLAAAAPHALGAVRRRVVDTVSAMALKAQELKQGCASPSPAVNTAGCACCVVQSAHGLRWRSAEACKLVPGTLTQTRLCTDAVRCAHALQI